MPACVLDFAFRPLETRSTDTRNSILAGPLPVRVSVSRAGRARPGTAGAARGPSLGRRKRGGTPGGPRAGGPRSPGNSGDAERNGGAVAARGPGAGGRRRRGAEPGAAGGSGRLAAAGAARLPLRAGLVLGLHPGRARRLLHRRGAGPRPRRAPQPPVQVRGPPREQGPAGPLWGCGIGGMLSLCPRGPGQAASSPVL